MECKKNWPALLLILGLNLASFAHDTIPRLNQQVVEYVKGTVGHQIDRGECWDLAYQALTRIEAKWDGMYRYGKLVNYPKEPVYPGDIVQFEGVMVKYQRGNTVYTETMDHHTAIILKVVSKGVFELAHQNTTFSGRKVGVSTLDLSTITKGKVMIYRPTQD